MNKKKSIKRKVKKSESSDKALIEDQEKYLKKLLDLYERERQTRCYFQLERDKLINLREIEKTKYDELKAKYLLISNKLAQLEFAHNKEMTHMSGKVQYLISEHLMKFNQLKHELNKKSNEKLNESIDKDNDFLKEIRKHISDLNEKCLNYDELIKNISNDYENRISKLNLDYSESIIEVQKASSCKFNEEREKFSLVTRNAINELNELKNEQITTMIEIKNKSFDDMRNYFQQLTRNLTYSIEKLHEKNSTNERNLKEKQAKLDKYSIELKEITEENYLLKEKFKSVSTTAKLYESESKIFKLKSKQFEKLSEKYKELDLKYEEILYAYERIRHERDTLSSNMTSLVRIFKEKLDTFRFVSNKKNEFLEEKLTNYEKLIKN